MGIFNKVTVSSQLITHYGAAKCGTNIQAIDQLFSRISHLTAIEFGRIPFTGNDLEGMFPDAEKGFMAAIDTALMRDRFDAVVDAQDAIGELAERKAAKFRRLPGDQTCGLALVAIHTVTALIVRDLVGSVFSDDDRRAATVPSILTPTATEFTQQHFSAAVEPWVAAFGAL